MSAPLRPLTPGDIVSTGFRLYQSNFRTYFVVAIAATLWLTLPFLLLLIPAIIIAILAGVLGDNAAGPIVLLSLVALVLWGWLSLKALQRAWLNIALISRLAYHELADQSETVEQARSLLRPRSRRIFNTFILSLIVLFGFNLGLSVASAPLSAGLVLLFSTVDAEFAAILITNVATLILYTWLSAHLFIVEVPVAVEENVAAGQAIGRSWNLSQGSAWRIVLVSAIAYLVTIPLFSLASIPPILGFIAAFPNLGGASLESQTVFWSRFLPGLILGGFVFLAMNMIVMGFWQATKAVVYYDLRSRREGVDISFRHRESTANRGNQDIAPERYSRQSSFPDPSPTSPPEEIPAFPLEAQISPAAKRLAGKLLEQADCRLINDGEWWQLRQYLEKREELDPTVKAQQSLELARQLRKAIALKRLPEKMTGDEFLEGLYWAILSSGSRNVN